MPFVPVDAINPDNETVVVSHTVMQNLVAAGHQSIEPFNGPQDGAPMYYIAGSALRLLDSRVDADDANAEDEADGAAEAETNVLPPAITQNTSNRQLRSRASNRNSHNIDPPHAEGSSGRTLRSHGRPNKEKGKKKSAKRI